MINDNNWSELTDHIRYVHIRWALLHFLLTQQPILRYASECIHASQIQLYSFRMHRMAFELLNNSLMMYWMKFEFIDITWYKTLFIAIENVECTSALTLTVRSKMKMVIWHLKNKLMLRILLYYVIAKLIESLPTKLMDYACWYWYLYS